MKSLNPKILHLPIKLKNHLVKEDGGMMHILKSKVLNYHVLIIMQDLLSISQECIVLN